ncbi:MAG: hypothetical protein ACREBO_05820 [Novosphingobium sp.]
MPSATKFWIGGIAIALLAATPGMAKKKKVVPPPPPAPVVIPVVVIPPKPYPPMRAAPNLTIPAVGLDGVRQTVNARISTAQTTWNLRSAWNVAALNCQQPQHAGILTGYKAYLKTHARALRAANLGVDAAYKKQAGIKGTAWIRAREAYMTKVYNYYASPPTLPAFCDAALAMSLASAQVPVGGLDAFSAAELPKIEGVFENFFKAYEQYRVDLALWEARYAPPPPAPLTLPAIVPTFGPANPAPTVASPVASAAPAATPSPSIGR